MSAILALTAACSREPDPTHAPAPTAALGTPAAVPTVAPTPVEQTAAPTARRDGGLYLAIGDSLTFGIGVRDPRAEGFPSRVASRLADAEPRIEELRVFAVPGETATGFVDQRLDDVTAAIEAGGERIELVTVALGANEVLRTRREEPCRSDRGGTACRALADAAILDAGAALDELLAAIGRELEAAGATAQVMVLSYYNPEVEAVAAETIVGTDGRTGCAADEARPGLNDRVACVAASHDAHLVDLYPLFLGREDELTHIGRGDVHPNADGYTVIADAVADAYIAAD